MELDDVGLSLGSRGAGDQDPSGGRLGRSGRLFGVELDDPPRRTPLRAWNRTTARFAAPKRLLGRFPLPGSPASRHASLIAWAAAGGGEKLP